MLCNLVLILPVRYTTGVSHSIWGNQLLGEGLRSPSGFQVVYVMGIFLNV